MRSSELKELDECATCKWKHPKVCEDCKRQKVVDDDLDKKKQETLKRWLSEKS